MIKTQEDFDAACNFIDSDVELYDFHLSERMSSHEYNLYIQDTEYFLNFLYEKIRTLEELCDYLDEYIDVKIADAKKQIDTDISVLQHALNVEANKLTRNHIPTWDLAKSQGLSDRDGTMVARAEQDVDILPASSVTSKTQPLLFKKPEKNEAYKDNLDTALQDNYYHTVYQQDHGGDPVMESVDIFLPPDTEYNDIEINSINCALFTEKIDDGIKVSMRPSGYDKERRNFSYKYHTQPALNGFRKKSDDYDPGKNIRDNYEIHQDKMIESWKKQCIDRTRKFQRTQKHNQDKSHTLGSI